MYRDNTLRSGRVWVKGGMVVIHAVCGCGAGSYLVNFLLPLGKLQGFFGLKCDRCRIALGKNEMRSYQDNMLRYMSGQIEPRKQ